MRVLIMFLFFIPIKSWACVEILENTRINETSYNFYADNGADTCVRLPYIRKDFSPEGVHISQKDIAYISMHHRDGKLPSRVVQADAKTGKVLKTYQLMSSSRGYLGKVSAVSLFDNETKFVVPTKSSLCVFDKKNSKVAADGTYKAPLLFCQKQRLDESEIAFISYGPNKNGHKYIWAVGRNKAKSKIYGYKILRGKILKAPTYAFEVPTAVGGVESLALLGSKAENEHSFLVSSVSGLKSSKMYEVKYAYSKEKNSYVADVKRHSDSKSLRSPASIAKTGVGQHKSVKLGSDKPAYTHKNLPALHQTVQNMVIKNIPLLPPK